MLAGNARAAVTPAVPPAGTINKPAPTFVDYCTPDPTAMPPFPGCPVDGTLPDGDSCEDIFATGTCSYFELEPLNSGLGEASARWPEALDPTFQSNLDIWVYECLTPQRTITGALLNPQPAAGSCSA